MNRLIFLILFIIALLFSCSQPVPLHFTRDEYLYIRRLPQVSGIDEGLPLEKGEIQTSVNFSSLTGEPDMGMYVESSYVSDDFSTITTRTHSTAFMTPYFLNARLNMGIAPFLATGISLDMSFGSANKPEIAEKSVINDVVFELGFNLRIASAIKKLTVGFMPELFLYTLNGELMVLADSAVIEKIEQIKS